jgi:uncharacterized membrane protein YhaH (DUF805 family)
MQWFMKVLNQYADFDGRARRKEYWMFSLIAGLISLGLLAVFGGLAAATSSDAMLYLMIAVLVLYALALMIPGIAVTTRRLHDTGHSGWWQLISLVPYVGGFVVLIFCVLDGNPGPNAYGPDPKALPEAGTGYEYPAPGMPY